MVVWDGELLRTANELGWGGADLLLGSSTTQDDRILDFSRGANAVSLSGASTFLRQL